MSSIPEAALPALAGRSLKDPRGADLHPLDAAARFDLGCQVDAYLRWYEEIIGHGGETDGHA